MPFQQTARIVGEHGDDVSEAERAAIDAVLPYDQLAELYDPDLSDPVKESYKLHNSKVESSFEYANEHPEALGDYLRVWLGLALRHPACALTATAANTYAYFYPGEVVDVDGTRPVLLVGWQTDGDIAAAYDVSYLMPANAVARASAAVQATLEVPGMRYLYSPGLYVWLLVAIVAYLIHARRWGDARCVRPARHAHAHGPRGPSERASTLRDADDRRPAASVVIRVPWHHRPRTSQPAGERATMPFSLQFGGIYEG